MYRKNLNVLMVVLLLACGASAAQVQVDQSRPASPGGEVYIESLFGSIEIIGWDRDEVQITGRLAAGAEGLEFDADEEEVSIEVAAPDHWLHGSEDDAEYRSDLVISVPRGSHVSVETLNAPITIDGVSGAIEIESVNGSVKISGDPEVVEIEAMTGNVEVRAQAAEMDVEALSGAVQLYGVTGSVSVEAVSGTVIIQGQEIEEISIESVSGDVSFDGGFAAEGEFEVETHSGNIELIVPGDVKARFEFETFNGKIENEIGPAPHKEDRFSPYTELRFSTGSGEFDVSVETFSGNITLRTR
jgi:DUF4097 and DUF4098 domain-containing protein YvlB